MVRPHAVRLAPLALVAVAAAQTASPPREALEAVAGYVAKVAGSAVFVSGRTLESLRAAELAPDTPGERLLGAVQVAVDRAAGTLTATLLGVSRTALHRPGFGCTLLPPGGAETELAALRRQVEGVGLAEVPADPWPRPDPWPPTVDEGALRTAVDAAFVDADSERPARTWAVVVVHDGALLVERYAGGVDAGTALPGWSMAKGALHALVGVRAGTGALALDEPLPLPQWSADGDPRRGISLGRALQMRAGLEWAESYDDPLGDVPRMLFVERAAGVFAAARRLADGAPEWRYSSGTSNLVSEALRASFADHADYLAFPRRALFAPIGMRSAVLEPDPSGTFVGSSFLYATARDWARLGELYRRGGEWGGERVLPEGWAEAAREPAPGSGGRYGAHWWLRGGEGLPAGLFCADGYQGQVLAVAPSLRAVVVRLGCTKDWRGWDEEAFLRAVFAAFGGG